MSATDLGNQNIVFRYEFPVSTEEINKLFNNILQPGLYNGGLVALDGANPTDGALIQPFSVLIKTATGQIVKVETTSTVSMKTASPLSIATPYLTMSYTWINALGNYVDFEAKDFISITSDDVVVGKAIYTGANITSFDYTERTLPNPVSDPYIGDTVPVILRGGIVTQGTGDTLDIEKLRGLVKFYSEGASRNAEVDFPAQVDLAIASATLDGSTVNYVKVRYHATFGYVIIVDSTATASDGTEIELGTFTGLTGNTFVFATTTRTVDYVSLRSILFKESDGVNDFGFQVVPGAYDANSNILEITSELHPTHTGSAITIKQGDGIVAANNIVDVHNKQIKNLLPAIDDNDALIKKTHDDFVASQSIFVDQNIIEHTYLRERLDKADRKLLAQDLINAYLTQRISTKSDFLYEPFFNEQQTRDLKSLSDKSAKLMDDTDWNNNWNERGGTPNFKNGFIKNQNQPYMLEFKAMYNLEGAGMDQKCSMSQYDSVNDCHWLMTQSGTGDNTVGAIVKLSPELSQGQVQVLAVYNLPLAGTSSYWKGIDSDGSNIYFCKTSDTISSNLVYAIKINTDGTLGKDGFKVSNGEEIDLTNSVSTSHPNGGGGNEANMRYQDVVVWDASNVMVLVHGNNATPLSSLIALDKTTLGNVSAQDKTNLYPFLGNTDTYSLQATKNGNDLWCRINSITDNTRHIYKFDITTDISSNVFVKASGRFGASNRDSDAIANSRNEGISISKYGELLEVVNEATNGDKFINERHLKNAKLAENQINEEIAIEYDLVHNAVCVDKEDSNFIWYNINGSSGADLSRLVKRNKTTGVEQSMIMTGNGTDLIWSMDFVFSNTRWYMIMILEGTGGNYYARVIEKSVVETNLGVASVSPSTPSTYALGTISALFGSWAVSTQVRRGICTDGTSIFVINDTNDRIEQWSLPSGTDGTIPTILPTQTTPNYVILPVAVSGWEDLAINSDGSKFYAMETGVSVTNGVIYEINTAKSLANSTNAFISHVYAHTTKRGETRVRGLDFSANKLYHMQEGSRTISAYNTLADPDTLQLGAHLLGENVLFSNNVYSATEIATRYFDPSEFADPRDVPDKKYMAVGYTTGDMSILHLDQAFGKSSSGLDRFDVTKVRVQEYLKNLSAFGTRNLIWGSDVSRQVSIEKDTIVTTATSGLGVTTIFLKEGKAVYHNTTDYSGQYYNGTLSERNDGKGTAGTYNPILSVSNTICNRTSVHTFTKEDSSDYQGLLPKTFIAVGTALGLDLIVIDWDENNNRTVSRVINQIGPVAVEIREPLVAKSGFMFWGRKDAVNTDFYRTTIPVWEITEETNSNTSFGIESVLVGKMALIQSISQNSRVWKTATGEWRHVLFVGEGDSGIAGALSAVMEIDAENKTYKRIYYYDSVGDYVYGVANDGERVYLVSGSNNNHQGILLKQVRDSQGKHGYNNNAVNLRNTGWEATDYINNEHGYTGSPRMIKTTGTGGGIVSLITSKFSIKEKIWALGGEPNIGLVLQFFPTMDNNVHESIDIPLTKNPSNIHLIKNTILPDGE